MSETASGLMRVVVLMLVTTAFAAVWSGDQQTQHAFIVARKAAAQRSQRTLLARRNAERVSHLSDASESSAADLSAVSVAVPAPPPPPRPAATGPSIVARVEVEFSLPSDIAPGRYQVVDETGVLETIYVPVISDSFAEQDIYLLNLPDGRRRYFIRITDPTAVDLAAPTATNDARRRR